MPFYCKTLNEIAFVIAAIALCSSWKRLLLNVFSLLVKTLKRNNKIWHAAHPKYLTPLPCPHHKYQAYATSAATQTPNSTELAGMAEGLEQSR